MRCPLCSGPLHSDDHGFECEVGPRVSGAQLSGATEVQVAEALWMAVAALDNEADVLRTLGGEEGRRYADDAELQARRLREFAQGHAQRMNEVAPPKDPDGRAS